jgi:hypothetical protein
LLVRTGLADDRRVAVGPGHRLYRAARWALERQDYWSDEQHAVFWESALVWWPQAESRRLAEDLAATNGPTAESHATPEADERSTRVVSAPPNERVIDPSHRDGLRFRRLPGTYRHHQRPLPRVYAEGEPEPAYTYFNSEIVLPPGRYGAPQAGDREIRPAAKTAGVGRPAWSPRSPSRGLSAEFFRVLPRDYRLRKIDRRRRPAANDATIGAAGLALSPSRSDTPPGP